jgi:hypothetical protein
VGGMNAARKIIPKAPLHRGIIILKIGNKV